MKRFFAFWVGCFIIFSTTLLCQEGNILEYKIGPRDLLDIRVFGLDDLNRTVRVSEAGKITLPLLGEIEVGGLGINLLEQKLADLLRKDWLQDPQVSVFIREYQSQNVSVLGAVGTPGPYELNINQTLLQIIAKAGSITEKAGDEIIIFRKLPDGQSESIRISIEDLMLRGDVSLNIVLRPDDIINVPPDKEIVIFVYGRVNNPGAINVKRSKIPTLQRAIAQAGGFSEGASKGKIVLTRRDETDTEKRYVVNFKDIINGKIKDVHLVDNDVIYVPETIF